MNPAAGAQAHAEAVVVGALVGGRYRVTARLGAGGMATIYRARDESLERDVAIKVLHAHLADEASVLARFRAEARAAAGLLHPNIVNVFDQGVADLPFIVMEYVDGPSLRQVLLQRGRLSPGEVLAVAEPVCRALARAHAAGLIHRDVKPENVLITHEGTPKVADFGIARAVAETSHTATGTLVGSVHYLAPELMAGEDATAHSDQYSLGVVLFELLTGRKPLPAETPMAVAMRHARERMPSVREFVSDAPAALDKVISRATAHAPAKRYPDLLALVAALDHAVPGGPRPVIVESQGSQDETLTIPVEAETTLTVERPRQGWRERRRQRRAGKIVGVTSGGRSPKRKIAMVLATLLLLAAGGLAAWNWLVAPLSPAPALTGMTRAEAAEVAEANGLELAVAGAQHDVEVAQGLVLRQDPDRDEAVRRGGTVTIILSAGPAEVTLPDVTGETGREAAAQLEADPLHLAVEINRVFHDKVPRGQVITQSPDPETTVLQGSEVTLRVSRGIEQVEVPELVGLSRDEAEAAMDDAKLDAEVTQRYSDEFPEAGTVIAQDVEPGVVVDKDTTVELTVSKGPVSFKIDNYVDQGLVQARDALRALDLEVRVVEQARPRIGPFRRGTYGRVEAQVPEAGTTVERGETVTLYTFSEAADQEEDD